MLADSGIVLGKVNFSKDGKAFYYSYARHWFDDNGSGTKEIRFDGNKWTKQMSLLKRLPTRISPDGSKMFLGAGGGAFGYSTKPKKAQRALARVGVVTSQRCHASGTLEYVSTSETQRDAYARWFP